MSWEHINDETVTVPEYQTREEVSIIQHPFAGPVAQTKRFTTKEPTGTTKEVSYSNWRCGNCRARACTLKGAEPGQCSKCKSNGMAG